MNLTLILRDVPIKDSAAYRALYSLCPKRVIYSVDFGLRSHMLDASKTDNNRKAIEYKLLAMQDIVPFNGASEICPLLPSFWFPASMNEDARGYAAGEAFRLFAGVKRVYFDLGVSPNFQAANEMAETIWKLQKDAEVVMIVPLGVLATIEYVPAGGTVLFAPYISGPLADSLKTAVELKVEEVFCGHLSEDDAARFGKITCDSPIRSLVFWSPATALSLNLPVREKCEDEPKAPEDTSKEMRALYTAMIWKGPSTGSEVLGHVGVDDKVKVQQLLKPNLDGTVFGKLALREGYVVVKHFNQEKFAETRST